MHVTMRFKFQRTDGKDMEIDVLAESDCGRSVLVEVKKTQNKMGVSAVSVFQEKVIEFGKRFPAKQVLPAFLSVGGFTNDALTFCEQQGIGIAERIVFF